MVIFFQLLHSDPFEKHWNYDSEGYKLCTLRCPIMESFRKMGLQEAVEEVVLAKRPDSSIGGVAQCLLISNVT